MAKDCYVKEVKAKNGEDSLLFKRLSEMMGDDQKALRAYLTTFTQRFKDEYGDWEQDGFPGKLDSNGEVPFEEFSKVSIAFRDVNLEDVEHPAVEQLDRRYSSMVEMKDRMIDVLTKKINILGVRTARTDEAKKLIERQITNLANTRDKIEELNTLRGMVMFTKNAIIEIENSYNKLQAMMKDKDLSPQTLAQFRNYVSAYDIIDEIDAALRAENIKGVKMARLGEAVSKKNTVKKIYMDHMKDFVAKEFSKSSYKRTERELRAMLDNADGDISWAEYLLDYMGDSKDPVLALAAKVVDEKNQQTRKQHIEFKKKLVDLVKELEGNDKTNTPSKLFGKILETNGNELTGNIVTPIHSITKKKNPAYEEIQKDPKMKKFYDFYMESIQEFDKFLPPSRKMGNSIPFIRRSDLERALETPGKAGKIIKDSLKDKFIRQGDDTDKGMIIDETNQIVDFIPIHYTQKIDSNVYQEELEKNIAKGDKIEKARKDAWIAARKALNADRSYDVAAALNAFAYSAMNYHNMSEVVDLLEGTRDIIKDRTFNQKDSSGQQIIDRARGLLNKKRRENGEASYAAKQIDEFMKMLVYGQDKEDAGYWDVMGIHFDKAKTLDAVNSYASFSLLGLNFLAGFQNTLQGGTMQWAEAWAGQFFTKENLRDANYEYYKEYAGILGDIGARVPENKVNLLNEKLDTLGDYKERVMNVANNTRFKKLMQTNTLFFQTNAGEHLMQTKVMIAMLKHIPALDKDGNKIESIDSMYEAYSAVDGKLVIDKRVAWTEADENRFTRQLQGILRRMHGNYPPHTAAAFQRNAWMRMIGVFRKWIRPGYLRRYEGTRDNEFLEDTTEGSYRSFGKFIKQYHKDIWQFKFDLLREDFNGLTPMEQQNIRRVLVEIGTVSIAMVAASVFTSLSDDDEDNKAYLFLAYQANRLRSELLFFINPIDMMRILKSPAASMSVIEASTRLVTQMLPHNFFEEYEKGPRKDDLKIWKRVEDVAPVYKQFKKAFTEEGLEAQLQWFNLN